MNTQQLGAAIHETLNAHPSATDTTELAELVKLALRGLGWGLLVPLDRSTIPWFTVGLRPFVVVELATSREPDGVLLARLRAYRSHPQVAGCVLIDLREGGSTVTLDGKPLVTVPYRLAVR